MNVVGSPSTPGRFYTDRPLKWKRHTGKGDPILEFFGVIGSGVIQPLVSRYSLVVVSQRTSTFTYSLAVTSVMIGRPVYCPAMSNNYCPLRHMPRKLYGEVRGLKAPLRRILVLAALMVLAVGPIFSSYSNDQGPAMIPGYGPPMTASIRVMVLFSGWKSRLASLYDLEMGPLQ